MSPMWHNYDVYRRSCDVSLRRSCVHGVIKCFVESLFVLCCSVISCLFAQCVELNVSEICKKNCSLVYQKWIKSTIKWDNPRTLVTFLKWIRVNFILIKHSLYSPYNKLPTCFICCLMKQKDCLEIRMNYLNSNECSFCHNIV